MKFAVEITPYDLDLSRCLRSGQVFRFRESTPGSWAGVEGSHWYRLQQREGEILVETNATEGDFRRFFRLDWDTREVHAALLKRGPELAPYIGAMPGLRILRQTDPTETLFTFLCTANNNVARIGGMVLKLAAQGEPLEGTEWVRFPRPDRIADLGEPELRRLGFGYRAATIVKAARRLAELGGSQFLQGLKERSFEESHAALTTLPGVGPKLADCILLFGLDHTEAVPVDTHIWQAAIRNYFPQYAGMSLTQHKYREIAGFLRMRFGRYAGWAQQLLFYDNHLNWRERKFGANRGEIS